MDGLPDDGDQPQTLKDLVSFRLHTLANLSARNAELRYRRKFGLRLLEWRVIGLLGGHGPLSLKEVGRDAGLDKGFASRTVSALIERGLVQKDADRADQRAVSLSLTDSGRELYRTVFADAAERNATWLSVLSPAERQALFRSLWLLADQARRLAREEKELSRDEE